MNAMVDSPVLTTLYNSGTVIADPSLLSTLCVFYEQVQLPAVSDPYHGGLAEYQRPLGGEHFFLKEEAAWAPMHLYGFETDLSGLMELWDKRSALLFQEGVLKRLPLPTQNGVTPISITELKTLSSAIVDIPDDWGGRWRFFESAENGSMTEYEAVYITHDYARHLLRADIDLSGVFRIDPDSAVETLKALAAHKALSFAVPRLAALEPDEILSIRSAVAATREGFSMHLQSLAGGVNERARSGATLSEIRTYAADVVETQLVPDFMEFRRQLLAERSGRWKRALDTLDRILQIDAAPWTPKFYGEIFKILGFSVLESVEARKDALSNRNQFMQFVRTVQDRAEG